MSENHEELERYLIEKEIDERSVLNDLLISSERFKKFYECEFKERKVQIFWLDNARIEKKDIVSQLPEYCLAAGFCFNDHNWVITVRNVPALTSDETTIAHELAHVRLDMEGFPSFRLNPLNTNREIEELKGFLNNMIHDPLVIIKLRSYGYDLREEYMSDCRKYLTDLSNSHLQPTGLLKLEKIFLHVQSLLENEILFDNTDTPCKEFNLRYGKKFKAVKKGARVIYEKIHALGYQNPESVLKIYKEILNMKEYNLSNFLNID